MTRLANILISATFLLPVSAQAADLKAAYLFQNSLSSSVAGAPALTLTDPTGTSGFVTDTVEGTANRTVFHVGGLSSPVDQQGGLSFDSTGLLTKDSYSIALTFEFFDRDGAWRRIVDVQDRTSDNGFYVDPSNKLDIFPVAGSDAAFTSGTYRNVVLTVGPSGPDNVHAYIDGGSSLVATTDIMDIGLSNIINIFLDNTQAGGQGEWSSANIAALSFYDGVLTADQARAINGDPLAPPPVTGAVPEPATWAMMIGGFGLAGGAIRRRRMRTTISYA